MNIRYWVAPLALLALAGCGDRSDTTAADNSALENLAIEDAAADNAIDNAVATAPLPSTPQEFVDIAASSDTYEIESSKLAETKAEDAKVKAFAAMLVKDHTKSTADLKAAAAAASPAITPNAALTVEQQTNIDALKAASGAEFDRLYLSQQVPAHEKALALLQGYSAGGDVVPLKEFASQVAPVVQQHLEEARALQP